MSREEIIQFDNDFQKAAFLLRDDPFTKFMGEYVSEATASEIANCVISQGKSYYFDIFNSPQKIPKWESINRDEDFGGIAWNIYLKRFNEDLPVPFGGIWEEK